MPLRNLLHRWLLAVISCLIIMAGCGACLLWLHLKPEQQAGEKYVINQVRLQVNDLVLYLNQNVDQLAQNAAAQEKLRMMSAARGISLIYVQLDGTAVFDSALPPIAAPTHSSLRKINLHTSLHYDLYNAKLEVDQFKIAFPIISERSEAQVGNAIFTLPENRIFPKASHTLPISLLAAMLVLFILAVLLLLWMSYKLKHHYIAPVHELKQHAETLLKGYYTEKIHYHRSDELGELFAMFDQMRLEMLHLGQQRMKQEKAQKELISNLSHDIKTPLTTVKAYIDAIQDGVCSDPDTMMEYMEVMQTNTNKMARLIDDLLIHALQELGEITVQPVEQYSRQALLPMFKPLGHMVRTSGVIFEQSPDIPDVLISIDQARIEQVLANIVANALKATSPGDTIRIETELSASKEQLMIKIADTGRGIRPQDMPFVFDRSFRGRMDTSGDAAAPEGTGLGLAICKNIVEAHGGSIAFKSKNGSGTVFHFTIPLC
ncbi:ATP-binding protein [Paenibacillus algorifonticola]|uniref:HAMP domain-containing sensor histidine kinase n=1 Tax=Paenibacillus algorifonticola TaxID=684063 RepID=UPI003D272EDD